MKVSNICTLKELRKDFYLGQWNTAPGRFGRCLLRQVFDKRAVHQQHYYPCHARQERDLEKVLSQWDHHLGSSDCPLQRERERKYNVYGDAFFFGGGGMLVPLHPG